jgi:alkylation response protein AidB-like acyl-CoA dehydrogenase
LRFVASNAETGVAGKATARQVEGGVILSGTKSFNSNSGGLGMAWVGCVLEGDRPARHKVLVDLRHPKVKLHDDWDTMGQRGTCSQTVTYTDVFVPDGWHQAAAAPLGTSFLGAIMLLHAALMQGIGDGALDALVRHARTMTRGSLPRFAGPAEDPLILRRVGVLSSRLAASRALLYATADAVSRERADVADDLVVDGVRAKVAAVEAALAVTAEVHEITGARSTSNAYRFDRYWRNARTFASHDPLDAKNVYIGDYELGGSLPALSTIFRF